MRKTNQLGRKCAPRSDILVLERLQLGKVRRIHKMVADDSLLVLSHVREQNRELRTRRQLSLLLTASARLRSNTNEFSYFLFLVFELQETFFQTWVMPQSL